MTPLYHRLVKRLTLPEKKREQLYDPHHLLDDLSDVHCFECSAIQDIADSLIDRCVANGGSYVIDLSSCFFPAPRTWIEIKGSVRTAFLWEDDEADGIGRLSAILSQDGSPISACRMLHDGQPLIYEDLNQALNPFSSSTPLSAKDAHEAWGRTFSREFFTYLSIINSPKVVNRIEHRPHKSLARKIIGSKAKEPFKLHPWHQIKLEIFKPRHIDDGEPHEDRITGKRALHFCRSFIRVRLGKLEIVRSHWRGDPAIGIRQASYVVQPPKRF